MNLLNTYSRFLEKRPLLGRTLTAGFLVWAGDMIAQILIEGRRFDFNSTSLTKEKKIINKFKWDQSLRAFIIGVSVISLNMYGWYNKIIPYLFKQYGHFNFINKYPILTVTILGILL